MTDDAKKQADEMMQAALEATARDFNISVPELKRRLANEAVPEWVQDMANAVPTDLIKGVVHDNRAPTGPSAQGIIPSSQQVSNVRTGGHSTGYVAPLSNPPGTAQADRLMDEQDRRDRIELAQRLGVLRR